MAEEGFPEIAGYKVIRCLGKGGMAKIYLAEQLVFQREVALKVMAPHLLSDTSFSERFLREARMLAQLTHPHFVPVYEVGTCEGLPYLTMEYFPGGNLKERFEQGLDLPEALRIVKEIADALDYAGGKSFVHRDIKPENVLFREDGSSVICDFGIARHAKSETRMTLHGAVVGTPFYMSPEQAKGAEVDARSDLYSLGIVLFEALTGKVPYEGDSAVSSAILHITEPIPRLPEEFNVFQSVIDKILAKLPADRYQNGSEFIHDLEKIEYAEWDLIQSATPTTFMNAVTSPSGIRKRRSQSYTGSRMRSSANSQNLSAADWQARATLTNPGMIRRGARSRVYWLSGIAASVIALGFVFWFILGDASEEGGAGEQGVVSIFDEKIRALNQQAELAIRNGRLYKPRENSAQHYLTSVLLLEPEDQLALSNMSVLFKVYLQRIEAALGEGNLNEATEVLNQASQIREYILDSELLDKRRDLRRSLSVARQESLLAQRQAEEVRGLLRQASEFYGQSVLTTPPGENAYDLYQRVIALEPDNQLAKEGIRQIASHYIARASEMASSGDIGKARAYIAIAEEVYPTHPELDSVNKLVDSFTNPGGSQLPPEVEDELNKLENDIRQRAEQRAREEQQIRESLIAAASYMENGELDEAAKAFNSVLQTDPTNEDAHEGRENVAAAYIDEAAEALDKSELDRAEKLLKRAWELSPLAPRYREVQASVVAARQVEQKEALKAQLVKEKVDIFFGAAELAMSKGNLFLPSQSSAGYYLERLFELDPDNVPARELRVRLIGKIDGVTRESIADHRFEDAQYGIDALAANGAEASLVSELEQGLAAEVKAVKVREAAERQAALAKARKVAEEIAAAEARKEEERKAQIASARNEAEKIAAAEARKQAQSRAALAKAQEETERKRKENAKVATQSEKLLTRARALGGPRSVTAQNFRDLGTIYKEVSKLEPRNAEAASGYERVWTFALSAAQREISRADFTAAQSSINWLAALNPSASELSGLEEELAYRKRQHHQAVELLEEADALTSLPYRKPGVFGSNTGARATLMEANTKIESATSVDPDNSAIPRSREKLLQKYAAIIAVHLEDGDADEAREFLDDMVRQEYSGPVMESLSQDVAVLEERAEEKRRGISVGSF